MEMDPLHPLEGLNSKDFDAMEDMFFIRLKKHSSEKIGYSVTPLKS